MNCGSCSHIDCVEVVTGKDGQPKGKLLSQKSSKCLLHYLAGTSGDIIIAELINSFQDGIKSACAKGGKPAPSKEAFNKVRGDWFEGIVGFFFWSRWNTECELYQQRPYYILRLPDAKTFAFEKLFAAKETEMLSDLKKQLQDCGVSLVTSNPDYVVVAIEREDTQTYRAPWSFSVDTFDDFSKLYSEVKGQCSYPNIVCAIGVKDSFRPDLRLQLVYEGNIFKAILLHLRTRFWDFNYQIPPFYAVVDGSKKPTSADMTSLKTATTNTLVDVRLRPERSVDEVFYADSLTALETVFTRIREALVRPFKKGNGNT